MEESMDKTASDLSLICRSATCAHVRARAPPTLLHTHACIRRLIYMLQLIAPDKLEFTLLSRDTTLSRRKLSSHAHSSINRYSALDVTVPIPYRLAAS